MVHCADIVADAGGRMGIEFYALSEVRTIASAIDLCRQVGFERAGVVVDSWHFFRGPDDWSNLESLEPSAIAYVQFDDALPIESDDLQAETLTRRALPGQGEFDLERFARTLRRTGFDGTVSIEVIGTRYTAMDPREFATSAIATSRPYWLGSV